MLALIGRNWIDVKHDSGERRLDDAGDFVRLEIETALRRNIAVTPVLVQGASMPAAHRLPESIRDFAYRNGFELSHNRWESDVREMLRRLDLDEEEQESVTGRRDGALKPISSYLPDLVNLLTGPKTAIARWTGTQKGGLTRALIFVTVSVAIGFLLQLPRLADGHNFATLVTGMAVFKVLALVSFAGIIHLLFRAVGGRARFAQTFAAYLYIVSPLYLVMVVLQTAALGVLRAHDPVLAAAAQLDFGQVAADFARIRAFAAAAPGLGMAYMLLTYGLLAIIPGWFVACWGALRHLHDVVRWRSALAGVATLVSAALFFPSLNYVLLGMFGTDNPPLH